MSTTTKPFTLYFATTPNGYPPAALLEELKAINPAVDYEVHKIDITSGKQKEPWFIKLNPNGRIPVLIDHTRNDFAVFETSAILLYLVQHYDKDLKFSFDPAQNPNEYSEVLQWLFFAHGGIGPMQGQANHFGKYAPERIPYAIKRYVEETKRLYGVLEIRLTGRDWLVGPDKGKYTIADIKAFPWIKIHAFSGIESLDEWPNVKAWLDRSLSRTGSQAAYQVGKQ